VQLRKIEIKRQLENAPDRRLDVLNVHIGAQDAEVRVEKIKHESKHAADNAWQQ
jgi:hypothetical protein